jgi:hypothetical protein
MSARGDGTAILLRVQAAYYLLTGVWPLVDMRTFEAATGPKREHWLVKTVGLAVAVAGASLWTAAQRGEVEEETLVLGAGTAAALGAVDAYYVARRRISPVYLLDAAAQAALLGGWKRVGRRRGLPTG